MPNICCLGLDTVALYGIAKPETLKYWNYAIHLILKVRSKNAKKNLRKKENKKLKEEEKANRPKKPEQVSLSLFNLIYSTTSSVPYYDFMQEPRLPSSVILPEHSALSHSIEDDEALFAEIQKRLCMSIWFYEQGVSIH